MKAAIHEIFPSIQGEGPYAGVRQVFVRFHGCNLRCSWCDTPAALGDNGGPRREMTAEEIVAEVRRLGENCHSVSITGGEPLVQANFLRGLLPELRGCGLRIYLETGGVLPADLGKVIDGVDIVSMDIKLPSSTGERPYWEEHAAFLRIARRKDCFLKAVISSRTEPRDVERMLDLVTAVDPSLTLVLQPNSFELSNGAVARCREYQALCLPRLPATRVMPQMHRMLKVR